jgi:hypothetical protein
MMQKPYSDEESEKEQKSAKVTPPDDERQAAAAAHFKDRIVAAPPGNNEFVVDNTGITILHPSGPVLAALAKVSEDDPGVVVQFYPAAVARAVTRANTLMPLLATWMLNAGHHYPISAEQLQDSLCEHLCQGGSGDRQGCILAPNNLLQYGGIRGRITGLMLADAFLIAICGPADCHPIAGLYTLADRQNATRGVHDPPPALPVAPPGGAVVAGVEVFD